MAGRLVRPYLTTRSLCPENQETPVRHVWKRITPRELMFRRNHFPYPATTSEALELTLGGEVENPVTRTYDELRGMPSRAVTMVLECSGNRRANFRPQVYGEQWSEGAVSQVTWRGVSLADLLAIARPKQNAVEVVFAGWDQGARTDIPGIHPFARSLPMPKALHPDTLVAYEMNGAPIPFKHGFPLRLIVPAWYGMSSVKWLRAISVIDHAFQGPFQTIDYVYYPDKYSDVGKSPVTTINVYSVIQHPQDWSILDEGPHLVHGLAWTGEGMVTRVEISIDGGTTWDVATLGDRDESRYAWIEWRFSWRAVKKGEYVIMARAWDSAGRVQPYPAVWNRKGYGYNAISVVHVKVE